MMLTRRAVTVGSATIATTSLALGPGFTSEALAAPDTRRRRRPRSTEGGLVVLDWEQVSFDTVYGPFGTTPPLTPIPLGAPVLGFVSLAIYHAACRSAHMGSSSESAAVAQAAHDVLLNYYPLQADGLQTALDKSLDAIGPGHARNKGVRIGADTARDYLRSREGDGYLVDDPATRYDKPAIAPYWQPTPPAADMLGAWLGSLRNLVVAPEPVPGHYTLGSSAWVDDYEEVRALGSVGSTVRTPAQTATALFHNSTNAAMTLGGSVIRYLVANPQGILETARIFAWMHGALADSLICAWQQKRDVGFWRPFQAIAGDDGNPLTTPEPGWAPLVPNPPYSDYLSGHGSATSPQIEVIRRVFGEDTALDLRSPTLGTRTYAHLSEIEHEACHARIWGGLHYRQAMTDAYTMGHRTAVRVMAALG